jgi:hypothetical protein
MNAAHSSAGPAEQYRRKAAELSAKALQEPRPELKAEYRRLAASYRRLAEQAERNSTLDMMYGPPSRAPR